MSESKYSGTETPIRNTETPNQSAFPAKLAAQFAEFLRQNISTISTKPPPEKTHHPKSLGEITVKAKLDGENYPLWANLMDRAIGGKGLTSHIDGVSEPPLRTDPRFQQWQQRDHCVFNWIINNIETDLVNKVSQYGKPKTYGMPLLSRMEAEPTQCRSTICIDKQTASNRRDCLWKLYGISFKDCGSPLTEESRIQWNTQQKSTNIISSYRNTDYTSLSPH